MMLRVIGLLLLTTMATSAAPFADVTDPDVILQDTAIVNQLLTSVQARSLPEAWMSLKEDGYIVHDVTATGSGVHPGVWRQLQAGLAWTLASQDWVRTNALSSTVAIDPPDQFPLYESLEQLWSDAGMSSNGWRRATSFDPSAGDNWQDPADPMWGRAGNEHGEIQAGDIFGPWIIDDLQRAWSQLSAVLSYRANIDWLPSGVGANTYSASSGGGSYITNGWSAVLNDVSSRWPDTISTNAAAPYAYYPGRARQFSSYVAHTAWGVGARRSRMRAVVPAPFSALGGHADFYAASRIPLGLTTNAVYSGASVGLSDGVFARFAASVVWLPDPAGDYIYSPDLGSLDLPPAADEPLMPAGSLVGTSVHTWRGWEVRAGYEAVVIYPSFPYTR